MPTHFFPLTIFTQQFEDETFLSEALKFPEISRFSNKEETAVFNARLNAEAILKDSDAQFLHNRIVFEDIEIEEIKIKIAPSIRSIAWREEIELKFQYLNLKREDDFVQLYVPILGITILTKKKANLAEVLEKEIVSMLKREDYIKSIRALRWLQRTESLSLSKEEVSIKLKTTKQRAIAEDASEEDDKKILETVGDNLAQIYLKPVYQLQDKVEKLANFFKEKKKKSILLVGENGVGKTSVFQEMVKQSKSLGLEDKQFWATSGARLIAGQAGFGMWQERCLKLIKETQQLNIILHLGNLVELLEVGKSSHSTQGIASFLRPKIASGELQVVVECTPEQLPILERRDSNLLSVFQQFRITELSKADCLKVLQKVSEEFTSPEKDKKIEQQAVKTTDAIYRRYSTYTALPAKPTRFLRRIFTEIGYDVSLTPNQVYRAFSNETGLPEILLNDKIKLNLSETSDFFQKRVIGQNEAVSLVVDLIATVKAKLTRPKKPIASLLFIGPTGVGKTEMVKSLAEFFFSDPNKMIRFDMSEFSNQLSVQRLIGGTGESEGLLTAKVREQPFSVILLDEFEKAHHSFFDLLLQILGEGRLTDSLGRTADFTNSIIVMTSNLGASEFQRGKSGFTDTRKQETSVKHFTSSVREFLRPEIFNRIDRIVPFSPLEKETVLKIAHLELEKIKNRDGLKFRKVSFDIDNNVVNHLANKGYDIRYGARPLKRSIERELLSPLSAKLNLHNPDEKIKVDVSVKNHEIFLEFIAENTAKQRVISNNLVATQSERIAILRRKTQKLSASYKLNKLSNEIYQAIRLEANKKRNKWISEENLEKIRRKPLLQHYLQQVEQFSNDINKLEDKILLSAYQKEATGTNIFGNELTQKEAELNGLLMSLLDFQEIDSSKITFTLFSEHHSSIFKLLNAYRYYFETFSGKITKLIAFTSQEQKQLYADAKPLFTKKVWRTEITDFNKFLANPNKDILGVFVELEGELIFPKFRAENGIHRFNKSGKADFVLFTQINATLAKFEIPDELSKRDSIKHLFERRLYDTVNERIKDNLLKKEFAYDVNMQFMAQAMEEHLIKIAQDLLE